MRLRRPARQAVNYAYSAFETANLVPYLSILLQTLFPEFDVKLYFRCLKQNMRVCFEVGAEKQAANLTVES